MAIFTAIIATIGTLISTFSAATVATFLVNTFAKAATSMLVSAILGGSKKSPAFGVQGKLQAGETVPRGFVLGKFAVAGSLVYANEWGKSGKTPNAYLTMVIALSDLPVSSLLRVMVNGKWATLSGTADPDGKGYPVNRFQLNMWVKFYDGTQTTADSFLTGTVSSTERPYASTRVGKGVAYAIVTTKFDRTLFSGFPTFKFEMSGIKFYDPSKDSSVGGSGAHRWATPSTWSGSNNPVVQAYNVLRGISYNGQWQYGFQGVSEGRLPIADWIEQIEQCNVLADVDGKPSEERYRSAGYLSYDTECGTALEAIMAAASGRIADIGGIYKPMVGYVPTAVASFTDDDLLSTEDAPFYPIKSLADTVNAVVAQYPSPNDGYALKDAPPVYRSDLEAYDQNRRLPAQVTLGNVPFPNQVQRLMNSVIEESRRTRHHSTPMPPSFWALEPNDIVAWTSARHGYSAKKFRVNAAMDLPTAEVVLDLLEVEPADYDFASTSYREETDATSALVIPEANTLDTWTVAATTIKDNAANDRRPALLLGWDADEIPDVESISYVIALTDGTVVSVGTIADVAETSAIVSEGILPGVAYKAKAKPNADRETEWTDWESATADDIRVGPSDTSLSEPTNLYRDFDMLDAAFYASSTGGAYTFVANGIASFGKKLLSITAHASVQSVETGWFAIEPDVEYRVIGAARLGSSVGGAGTMTLKFETASYDSSGVITSLGTTTVGTRTDSATNTPFSVSVTTGASARLARFVGERSAGGTQTGVMAGLKVQKAVTVAMMATNAVTTSSIDTTAGRLVKTGDFGLGTAISLTASDNLNALVTSGLFYNATSGNCAGNNYPITSAGALTIVARSATNVVQKFISYADASTAASVREFTRSYGGSGWSPWVELFHQGTVLGTVSQSGGVPTGKVIERGSNANGEYVRFADGTQICTVTAAAVDTTTAAGGIYMHTNILTWTFPAAFAAAPVVAGGGGNAARWLAPNAPSVNSAAYRVYSYGSSGTLSAPSLTATGRWF